MSNNNISGQEEVLRSITICVLIVDVQTTEQTSAVGEVARSVNTSIIEAYAIDWRGKAVIQMESH